MRGTRDLLRRRNLFVRRRAELTAHVQNTYSQYNVPTASGKGRDRLREGDVGSPARDRAQKVWRGRVGHRPPRPTPDEEGFPVANRSEPAAASTRTRNNKAEDRRENEKRFEVYGAGAPT
jgi:hypothetical protein